MKKRITAALLLVIVITACLLTACGETSAPASADSMEGTYRLVDAAGEGSYDLLQIKDGVHLDVRADNTATLSLMTDTHELLFDSQKNVCVSDGDFQQVPYTFDGKQIVMDTDPFRMVFERQ